MSRASNKIGGKLLHLTSRNAASPLADDGLPTKSNHRHRVSSISPRRKGGYIDSSIEDRVITIVGHDPGSHNYGVAVVKFVVPKTSSSERNKYPVNDLRFSIVLARKMKSCLTDLKSSGLVDREIKSYLEEVQEIERRLLPQAHIAERYQSRRFGGVTIELVNMTLGALRHHGYTYGSPIKLIPASQWKNELKRRGVILKEVYKQAKAFKYSDHEVDAVFIALYGACYVANIKPYNFNDMKSFVDAVLFKLEKLKEGGGKLQS